jgi:hypothetical protein
MELFVKEWIGILLIACFSFGIIMSIIVLVHIQLGNLSDGDGINEDLQIRMGHKSKCKTTNNTGPR